MKKEETLSRGRNSAAASFDYVFIGFFKFFLQSIEKDVLTQTKKELQLKQLASHMGVTHTGDMAAVFLFCKEQRSFQHGLHVFSIIQESL